MDLFSKQCLFIGLIAAGVLTIIIVFFYQQNIHIKHYHMKTSNLGNEKEIPKRSDTFCIMDERAFKKLALTLRQHALDLLDTQRSLTFSAQHFQKMGQHLKVVNEMLKSIRGNEIQNNNSFSTGKRSLTEDTPPKQEVCPEKYMGTSTLYGWPFYRKGFERVSCTDFVPIHKLVTVLLSIPQELPKPAQSYVEILKGVAKYYPKMRVILATENAIVESTRNSISNLNITFENLAINGIYQSTLWQRLIDKVETSYVLIAPHVTHFDDDINLERLVRVLSYDHQVAIAGGSYRNIEGEWNNGCQQVSFRNWTATYKGGYYHSFNECIVCDFLSGPWMAKTKVLKHLAFDNNLKYGAFHDLFWRLKKIPSGEIAVSCPDVMFNIETRDVRDEEYLAFANKHLIHKMVDPDGRVRWYGCRRGYSHPNAKCPRPKGIGLSPADMENLADAIKFLMRECKNAGAFCEIQAGTLLGAVKFNGILPWDQDGDVVFLSSNLSALENLKDKLTSRGYALTVETRVKEMRSGRPLYGAMNIKFSYWRIDMFGHLDMQSKMLVASGRQPTKMLFAGEWVTVMRNPGLYARNHYGHEIYRHQEHLRSYGRSDRMWGFYDPGTFFKCPIPGHSACLDQYPADGSMQFSNYCNC